MAERRRRTMNAHTEPKINRFSRYGLLFTAAVLPWPHGGELIWEFFPFCVLLLVLLAFSILKNKESFIALLTQYRLPFLCFALWLLYGFIQAAPLPRAFVVILSPKAAELSGSGFTTLSIAPGLTLIDTLKNSSYIAALLLCMMVITKDEHRWQLANTLFISSALMAGYSLLNHYTKGAFSLVESIPPWTITWEEAAHGTFSYQNHYAAFLNLTIPLGFALAYRAAKRASVNESASGMAALLNSFIFSPAFIYVVCCLLMVLALVSTSSRGGNLMFIASLVFLLGLHFGLKKSKAKFQKPERLLPLAAVVICVGSILFFTGATEKLSDRYVKQGLNPNGRDYLRETAMQVIADFPITGTGAGTYPAIQHAYKLPELQNSEMSKHAHNDYLELLSNQGVIGLLIFGTAMVSLLASCFKQIIHARRLQRFLHICCCTGVLSICLHSVMDFNFQLAINNFYYYLLLALPLADSKLPIKKPKNTR